MKPQLIWHAFSHSLLWQTAVGLALMIAGALIVQLYRYERRLVSASVGNSLLILRLLVLVATLLTLLEPTISWTWQLKRNGRILVAVDVSESMATADVHALPAEKMRWARALGMIDEAQAPERVAAWQTAYDNDQEPEWVLPAETANPDRRRRLSEIRKQAVEQALEDVGQIPRREIALRLLQARRPDLLTSLEKLGTVQLHVFGGTDQGTSLEQLPRLVSDPPVSLEHTRSDLSQPLSTALSAGDSDSILGVVLMSDGRDNAGRDLTGLAARLGNLQAPVYPVLLGSRLRPKDLAIGNLDFPQTVFLKDQPVLRATINTAGFEGQAIELKLQTAENAPVIRTVTPAGPFLEVELPLEVTGLGRHEFTLSMDPRPGETRRDNNSRQFAMTVIDDKVHVLIVDEDARWEFRYLDNALKRDARVELHSVLFSQPYLGVLDETFFPRSLEWPANDDPAQSPLAGIDLLILGDVNPSRLPPQGWRLIERFVAESGGTLVCTAGKRNVLQLELHPLLAQMLPVAQLSPLQPPAAALSGGPTERGFHLRLTPEAEQETMFQFNTDLAINRGIWASLPGHLWGLTGTAKPGSTVFAAPYTGQQQLTLEQERRQALIAQQYYGQGQVLWLGLDSTWRWRHRVGDQYHHRFWGQLGRWAANNKAVAGNGFVKFGPDRPDIVVGDTVTFRARWTAEYLRRFPRLEASVNLYRTGAPQGTRPYSSLKLNPNATRPLVYEVQATNLPAGSYRAELSIQNADAGTSPVTASLFVQEPPSIELADLSGNRDLMVQLAQLSGGELIEPDALQKIPELLRGPTATETRREEILLWNHWLVLVIFSVLLMTEWVIRKLNGLP